jgi:hypothetical protein
MTARVRKLPLPQVLKDVVEAMKTSTPPLRAANAKQEKIIALLDEVENERSRLSAEERDARRREIDGLWKQVRCEKNAARRPMDELKARYPRWIK